MPFKDFDLDRPDATTLVAESNGVQVHLATWQDLPELDALREANRDWLAEWTISNAVKQRTGALSFAVKRDGAVVGELSVWNVDRGQSAVSPSLSYWVAQPHARQGIMKFAVAAVLRHTHQVLHLDQVLVPIAVDNVASLALAESLGLRKFGQAEYTGAHSRHVVYVAEKREA